MSVSATVSEIHIDVQRHIEKVRSDPFWTFAATEWHRLYYKYIPMQTGTLANTVVITPGQIEHTAPYARYLYYGEVYGPNYPIMEGARTVGYFSKKGRKKHKTGRAMEYSHAHHPMASKKWDKAAEPIEKPRLIHTLQSYVDSGRLHLDQ